MVSESRQLLAAEMRLREVPWAALLGLGPSLDGPLEAVLAGTPAERVLDRLLRSRRDLSSSSRTAVAEAIFGVGLWRRRLRATLGSEAANARLLLAVLLRDLGGVSNSEAVLGLPEGALPEVGHFPVALADRASLPDWLTDELFEAVGSEAADLAGALNQPGPIVLRANRLKTTREELAQDLLVEGVATRPASLCRDGLTVETRRPNLLGLRAEREGRFEVQDEASQLVGELVEAVPGDEVLDFCAGAGGKTLLLAAAVGTLGRVHAADPDGDRLRRMRNRLIRAGAERIVAVHGASPPDGLRVGKVLVDAPCSELGTLRRGPDLRWRMDPKSFGSLPALQGELLLKAALHVAPGGLLVYATCTFREAENEAVAKHFESRRPEFERLRPALCRSVVSDEGFVRTLPHLHGTDAFFAAQWRRASAP